MWCSGFAGECKFPQKQNQSTKYLFTLESHSKSDHVITCKESAHICISKTVLPVAVRSCVPCCKTAVAFKWEFYDKSSTRKSDFKFASLFKHFKVSVALVGSAFWLEIRGHWKMGLWGQVLWSSSCLCLSEEKARNTCSGMELSWSFLICMTELETLKTTEVHTLPFFYRAHSFYFLQWQGADGHSMLIRISNSPPPTTSLGQAEVRPVLQPNRFSKAFFKLGVWENGLIAKCTTIKTTELFFCGLMVWITSTWLKSLFSQS